MDTSAVQTETHEHPGISTAKSAGYGPAVTDIWYHEGRWWIGNGEYATEAQYCPFCGGQLVR